jgi:hypothetical protein
MLCATSTRAFAGMTLRHSYDPRLKS